MKKKNFLNGFNAKIAFAIIALTGVLLTGCYKDDGLDVNNPAGSVVLPDATYTINGTVIDGTTGAPVTTDLTVSVNPSTNFSLKTNSFTATVQPGDVTITVSAKDYETITKVVTINAIEKGQAAVYTQIIPMVSTVSEPTSKIAKFDVDVEAFLADTKEPFTAYTAALYTADGNTSVAMTDVAAGVYKLVVTPTDTSVYETYTSIITLDEVVVPADFTGNLKRTFVVYINKVTTPADMTTFSCTFESNDGNGAYKVKEAHLTENGVVKVSGAMTSTISYEIATDEIGENIFAVVYTYIDDSKTERTGRAIFAPGETTISVVINPSSSYSAVMDFAVIAGKVEAGTESFEDASVVIGSGITATVNGTDLNKPFSLQRDFAEQKKDAATIQCYIGTPDNTDFSSPIKIVMNDDYDNELGALELLYKEGTDWVTDAAGGSITSSGDKYTMNIKHFSEFKASVSITVDYTVSTDTDSQTFTVDKLNDSDEQITVGVNITTVSGTQFSVSVEDAIKNAGFTNAAAITKIESIINQHLTAMQIHNTGFTYSTETVNVPVPAYTRFDSYDRVYTYTVRDFKITINGKEISFTATTAVKTELTNVQTTYVGHGHGHGHGNGNLAGGGIIDAE